MDHIGYWVENGGGKSRETNQKMAAVIWAGADVALDQRCTGRSGEKSQVLEAI